MQFFCQFEFFISEYYFYKQTVWLNLRKVGPCLYGLGYPRQPSPQGCSKENSLPVEKGAARRHGGECVGRGRPLPLGSPRALPREILPSVMRRWTRNFNIPPPPPPGQTPGIWTFEDRIVQIPAPSGQNGVQMPYLIVGFVCQMPLLKNNGRRDHINRALFV